MTLARLRAEMSAPELRTWEAYVEENGPIHPALRMEAAVARAVSVFVKNGKPRDFMPWPKAPEPQHTPDTLLLMFKNAATQTRSKH